MSEQKISEFRERAQVAVAAPDPDLLLRRGRALRHRRQLVPVAALAACAAIAVGLLAPGGGNSRTDQPPAGQPTVTETPDPGPTFLGDTNRPGTYAIDSVGDDGLPDATVDLVGDGWRAWPGGSVIRDSSGTASWGFQRYADTPIDQCDGLRRATTMSGALTQLSQLQGTVTRAARPATKLGLTGTYLQLSVPVIVRCPNGYRAGSGLMATWSGSPDPTVTVDVWLLEDSDRLLLLTRGVRGNPSPATLENLDRTLDTLRFVPTS